jgi:hypothetical protein
MARVIYLVRFFRVVPPTPPLIGVTLAVTTSFAAAVVVADPDRARQALMPLLVLQLFACSSGFMIPARRGHYDLVLTSGESRLGIAAAHWMMSALPGVAGWLLVSLVQCVVTRGEQTSALASGSVLAWAVVSTLPWAITVALPRFAGAIGWMLVLAVTASLAPRGLTGGLFDAAGGGRSWFEEALVILLYPPVTVGEHLVGPQGWLAAPALLIATTAMVYAFGWIEHDNIPLEAAQ